MIYSIYYEFVFVLEIGLVNILVGVFTVCVIMRFFLKRSLHCGNGFEIEVFLYRYMNQNLCVTEVENYRGKVPKEKALRIDENSLIFKAQTSNLGNLKKFANFCTKLQFEISSNFRPFLHKVIKKSQKIDFGEKSN